MSKRLLVPHFVVFGSAHQSGSYILCIEITTPLFLSIGRFKNGQKLLFEKGQYIYIGSAMGSYARYPLYRRIIRHAKRSEHGCDQPILSRLQEDLLGCGLGKENLPFSPKNLFWNIDYLLECKECIINRVYVLRSEAALETKLVCSIQNHTDVSIPHNGLGANDSPGNTHFLKVPGNDKWWNGLERKLNLLME